MNEAGTQGAASPGSACLDDRLDEAEKWLQTAVESGVRSALLQLSYVSYHTGREDDAIGHLEKYLGMLVGSGRDCFFLAFSLSLAFS